MQSLPKARVAEHEKNRNEAEVFYKDQLSKMEMMRLDFELKLKEQAAINEKPGGADSDSFRHAVKRSFGVLCLVFAITNPSL